MLKWRKGFIAFLFDLSVIPIAWFGAYWIFSDLHTIPDELIFQSLIWFFPLLLIQALACWAFGLYRGVWRFASIPDLVRITKAVVAGTGSVLLLVLIADYPPNPPRVIPFLYGLLLAAGLAAPRALFRWLKDYRHFFQDCQRVLIIGAGYAGEGLVRDLFRHNNHLYQPIGLIDDHPAKQGREIHGIRVIGKCEQLPLLVKRHKIDLIFIATPSASATQMRHIVDLCEATKLPFRTLPGIGDLASGRVDIRLLRDVSLEDLLGRDQVKLDWDTVGKHLQHKTILVSGGGGSIGSELCRQIATLQPKKLLVVDNSEFNLYSIDMELRKRFPTLDIESVLLSITDSIGLRKIFSTYHPDIVFHAAAYKHVPLLEKQARVAIHNNVLGTNILAHIAVEHDVSKFILISTDKAVNPANLMGATKRAAEMICQYLHAKTNMSFITVRFGNVLDSAGSVVPLFRKQIQEGGPITVTHEDITRYFMSIPEASQLIIEAASLGQGGEIFVLDMGEPIKIRYLAEQMIKLAGKAVGSDIDIVYTGLRPGEKLYEELFYENETLQATTNNKIMLASARSVDEYKLLTILDKLEEAYYQNSNEILAELLSELVPEYKEQTYFTKNRDEIELKSHAI